MQKFILHALITLLILGIGYLNLIFAIMLFFGGITRIGLESYDRRIKYVWILEYAVQFCLCVSLAAESKHRLYLYLNLRYSYFSSTEEILLVFLSSILTLHGGAYLLSRYRVLLALSRKILTTYPAIKNTFQYICHLALYIAPSLFLVALIYYYDDIVTLENYNDFISYAKATYGAFAMALSLIGMIVSCLCKKYKLAISFLIASISFFIASNCLVGNRL